eukprot:scaffold13412_cov152-Isochrysis_galbana.AAC.1
MAEGACCLTAPSQARSTPRIKPTSSHPHPIAGSKGAKGLCGAKRWQAASQGVSESCSHAGCFQSRQVQGTGPNPKAKGFRVRAKADAQMDVEYGPAQSEDTAVRHALSGTKAHTE